MSPTTQPVQLPPPSPLAAAERGRQSWARHSSARVLGSVGAGCIVVLVGLAVLAPLLARHDPQLPIGRPFERPSAKHLLGTNDVGQDLFAQLLHGGRVSLSIGVLSALLAVFVGFAVALLAGYHRGRLETALMRLVDLTLALPFLVLVIVLAAFFGRSLLTTVAVIGAVIWARPARVLRSQVLKVREFPHVVAAQAMGASSWRVIGHHVLPRTAPLAAAQFVRAANISVLIEASLAFLGLGDPDRVSWGTTLFFANARSAFLTHAWLWWILPPGLALTLAIVGFAFLGYAVEEWADPRLSRTAPRRLRRSPRPRQAGYGPASSPNAHPTPPGPSPPGPGPMVETSRSGPVLEVRDLAVHYRTRQGPLRAVDGVSLTVHPRRIVGLVGESGSGKSTLAMAVTGLLRPPARVVDGKLLLNGRQLCLRRPVEVAARRGRDLALIPQNALNALNPAYTVLRQVAEAAGLARADPERATTRARELLEIVGIPPARHRSYPHELSGGMRQRVVIAMAIANEPALLIADEPLTGLDVVTQARILGLLGDLREQLGLAMLLVSHDLPLVARVADELLVFYAGQCVESGPTTAVMAAPAHPYTRQLLRAFPRLHGPRQHLVSIAGDPPDLLRLPVGCPFQPRCPDAIAACRDIAPQLLEQPTRGHRAACLLRQPS